MSKKVKVCIDTGDDQLRVVIVGPMRGHPDWNYPLFSEVKQAWLDQHPHDIVLNPAENFDGAQDREFSEYLQASLEMVLSAQFVVLLPGWEQSEGAGEYEVPVARVTSKIFYEAKPYARGFEGRVWEFEHVPAPAKRYPLAPEADIKAAQTYLAEPCKPDCGKHSVNYHRRQQGYPEIPEFATGGILTPGFVRTFDTGATRDQDTDKLDYEGFLSPLVLERYAQYMHKHRKMNDNSLRTSDNWQKGIPLDAYMKSMFRHFMDVWHRHRVGNYPDHLKSEALCGVLFNAMGYLHELEKRSKW